MRNADIEMSRKAHIGIAVFLALILLDVGPSQGQSEDEVIAAFRHFIEAQNAHDLTAAGEILDDSSESLWISRGTAIRGREAILKGFESNYRGTWIIAPEFDEAKLTALAPDVVQLLVPAQITIAPEGQSARPRQFLLTQLFVRRHAGWKLTTIVTVPGPQSAPRDCDGGRLISP
jgi:ketosteroid isomerase-like protein